MRIAVSSSKGGCGKTTTVINLGAAFASEGLKVCAIDCDPQGSLNDWAGVRPEELQMPYTIVSAPRKTIARDIESIQGDSDLVLIDCPPRSSAIATAAIASSDIVLIPVTGSSFDLWAAENTLEDIELVKQIHPDLKVFMFHSRAVVGSSITQEMNAPLKELDTQLLKSIIHSRVSIARSADGKTIFEGSDDKAKQEYKNLKREITKLMEVV